MSHQLSFSLQTSSRVKTVHLLGSWDNYTGQLSLAPSPSKPGRWKGIFRFASSNIVPGCRYWYYYILDGYQITCDSNVDSTREPTTGRHLNILDVAKSTRLDAHGYSSLPSKHPASSRKASKDIARGRGVSPSKIISPKPSRPYASRAVREADYFIDANADLLDLSETLQRASLCNGSGSSKKTSPRHVSPPTTSSSSSSYRSRASSNPTSRASPSSLSSVSDPALNSSSSGSRCSCNRFGITRRGERVKSDCGGARCGYSDDSSSCSSIEEGESSASASSSDDEGVRGAGGRRRASAGYASSSAKSRMSGAGRYASSSTSRRR